MSQPLPIRIQLGRNVNRIRMMMGLTQDKLAELADIDRRYVQRIEAGTANPGVEILERVRLALDTTWNELLEK